MTLHTIHIDDIPEAYDIKFEIDGLTNLLSCLRSNIRIEIRMVGPADERTDSADVVDSHHAALTSSIERYYIDRYDSCIARLRELGVDPTPKTTAEEKEKVA
jgi:hypothetical protein